MKKIFVIIFSLCFSFYGISQHHVFQYTDYYLFEGDTINHKIDEKKEGKWMDFEIGISSSHSRKMSIRRITSKGNYTDNIKTGEWNYFYENGKLKRKSFYNKKGEKTGLQLEYFQNGNLKCIATWENGNQEKLEVFHKSNKTKYLARFSQNQITSFQIFYPSGKIKYLGSGINKYKIKHLLLFDESRHEKRYRKLNLADLLINEKLGEYL